MDRMGGNFFKWNRPPFTLQHLQTAAICNIFLITHLSFLGDHWTSLYSFLYDAKKTVMKTTCLREISSKWQVLIVKYDSTLFKSPPLWSADVRNSIPWCSSCVYGHRQFPAIIRLCYHYKNIKIAICSFTQRNVPSTHKHCITAILPTTVENAWCNKFKRKAVSCFFLKESSWP